MGRCTRTHARTRWLLHALCTPCCFPMPPTDLAKVARVVLVKVDAHVVLATSITAAVGVLAVLANTTVAGGHMPTRLPVLLEPCVACCVCVLRV